MPGKLKFKEISREIYELSFLGALSSFTLSVWFITIQDILSNCKVRHAMFEVVGKTSSVLSLEFAQSTFFLGQNIFYSSWNFNKLQKFTIVFIKPPCQKSSKLNEKSIQIIFYGC